MRALCMLFIPQLYFYFTIIRVIGGLIPFLIIILLHSKFRFNAVSMILVGVALFVLLMVLEILTQNPLMKIPQGLTMKIWSDVYILAVSALLGLILTLLLSPKLNLLNLDDIQARSIGFNLIVTDG